MSGIHPQVRSATLGVAAAEAHADAALLASKLALRYQELRLHALRQLDANGHAR